MKSIALLSAALLLVTACGGGEPEPAKAPEPVVQAPPKAPEPAPATTAPPAEPAPAAVIAPPPTLKASLGVIAKIEVLDAGKKKVRDIAKADEVAKLTSAIGLDQAPDSEKRTCTDEVTLVFRDDAGTEKGNVAFCKAESLGAEFWSPSGDRKGFSVVDEGAVRKLLKLEAPKAKAAPPAAAKAPTKPASKK